MIIFKDYNCDIVDFKGLIKRIIWEENKKAKREKG